MIAVNVNAGLANQMFHYAFGRGLINKGFDVVFDQSSFKPRKQYAHENIRLQDAFPQIDIKQMPEGHFKWVMIPPKRLKRYLRKFFMIPLHELIGDEHYIFESKYAYIPEMERRIKGNCILLGFWQSEKYFSHCADDIRKQFTFLPFDEEKNMATARKMAGENSVSIHFRKGSDYLVSRLMGNGLCGIDYYMNAIDYIKKSVPNPVFYVFTDNREWVNKNLPDFEYTFVDWNETAGKRSFRDMQLMSCCKHNIIANSTYSWWGAWLNPNSDKIVIGPKVFFNPVNEFFQNQDIMCDSWVKL